MVDYPRSANQILAGLIPVRVHSWVEGWVSRWGRVRGHQSLYLSHIDLSLPFLPSLPLSLKMKNILKKKKKKNPRSCRTEGFGGPHLTLPSSWLLPAFFSLPVLFLPLPTPGTLIPGLILLSWRCLDCCSESGVLSRKGTCVLFSWDPKYLWQKFEGNAL